jgi:hypothetical protein
MGMSAVRHAGTVLLAAAMFTGLSACSENPQRVFSEGQGSYNIEKGSPLAERTRNQSESERIY